MVKKRRQKKERNATRAIFVIAGLIIMFLLTVGSVALLNARAVIGEAVEAESLFEGETYYVFPSGGSKGDSFSAMMPLGSADLGIKLEGADLNPPTEIHKREMWLFAGYAKVDGILTELDFKEERNIMVIKRPEGLDDEERNRAEVLILWRIKRST